MATAKTERSIRLLGRKTLDLDRITGTNGEFFYDTDTQSLRIYTSGGSSSVLATRTWVTSQNYITSTGIPTQTGQSGKYLTTNGTAVSWGTITATAAGVGLGNVTNESKATMFSSPTTAVSWGTITATHVGLGSVPNESKATMFASPAFTGTPTGITATHAGLGNVTNESKATMFSSPTFTGGVGVGGASSVITGTSKSGNYLDVQGFLQLKGQSGGGNIDFKPSNSSYRTANIEGTLTAGTTPQLLFMVSSSIESSIVTTTVEMNSSGTQSTSSTTGALVVTGGVGISKNLYVDGSILSRINSRVTTAASASALTPDISVGDIYAYTALAAGLTVNAPIGTPVDGNKLMFRLLDNGTARALTWNATYTVIGVTLPTTTVVNKTTYVGCIYNANNSRWDVIAVSTQA